jgi:hypothetical protein
MEISGSGPNLKTELIARRLSTTFAAREERVAGSTLRNAGCKDRATAYNPRKPSAA